MKVYIAVDEKYGPQAVFLTEASAQAYCDSEDGPSGYGLAVYEFEVLE